MTMKDVRETPLKFASYAVSYKKGHPCVRIERQTYLDLRVLPIHRGHSSWY